MKRIKENIVKNISYSNIKKQFISFKKAQGLADRTLKDYNRSFEVFERYYLEEEKDVNKMKEALIKMFEKLSNGAPATFNVPYSNLMCFFNWSVENEYLEKNPLKLTGLKKKKDVGRVRSIPQDVISKLLDIMKIDTYIGLRDYTILILTLDVGIRPSEAFGLELEDIDLEHSEITIRPKVAKTRILRVLPISYQTVEILRKFLSIREDDWLDYLFLTINGTKMTTNTWGYRMKYYRQKLEYSFTGYDFRHSFSILFLKNRW